MKNVTLEIEKHIRSRQIYLLDYINTICKDNDIKYFLVGGSFLGARKYHDFIPGDKDIDVGMLRADYDRFLKIATSNKRIRIINCNTEENFNWYYTKVCLKKTKYSNGYENDYGIFVDVMPYDFVPTKKTYNTAVWMCSRILKTLFMLRDRRLQHPTLSIVCAKIDREFLILKEKKFHCNLKNSQIVQNYFCGKRTDWFYLNEINNGYYAEFNKGTYFVPNADRYLDLNYNDWRINDYKKSEIYKYKFEEINDGITSNSDNSN